MHHDIFNGDADGIFALHQYRLHLPLTEVRLVTGVKRDICLLKQLEELKNCSLTVFDISLDSNRASLQRLLGQGNSVSYFDHHFAGSPLASAALETYIDTSPETCTSLIVNTVLKNRFALWAICGAFGDNLHGAALKLAGIFHLSEKQITALQELGELFNYNGYGSVIEDLLVHPQELYLAIKPYADPFEYLEHSQHIAILRDAYKADIALALQEREVESFGKNRVYQFPDRPWARRIGGVFSNIKARERTSAAHTIITENQDGSLRISVRAPLDDKRNADTLCKLFPTGGGRAGAAGINSLPKDKLEQFLQSFETYYS